MAAIERPKIKFESVEELLGVPIVQGGTEIVKIRNIHPFKDHPFRVTDDEKMDELVDSIQSNGVLLPVLIRPRMEGGYEMISGHRRMHAASKAGLDSIPAIIKDMTDDEAVITMVDSNLQREKMLPSEKAFAYKMKLEAMKRTAGRPSKNNSCQVGTNFRADSAIAANSGESARTIHRYIRLTALRRELLEKVDRGKMKFNAAVEISYIPLGEQDILLKIMDKNNIVPTLIQAQQLRKLSQDGDYTKETVHAVFTKSSIKERHFTLRNELIRKYFKEEISDVEIETIICGLLDEWKGRRTDEQNRRENDF